MSSPPSDHPRKTIALIFPMNVAYSQLLTAGIIERHLQYGHWNFINLPRKAPGVNPLPEGDFPIDGAIVWTEPRDHFVKDLVKRGIPVVNCGMEWENEPGIVRIIPDLDDFNQKILHHFLSLGLKRMVVLGHGLDSRPATRAALQAVADLAIAAGVDAVLRDIGGEKGPANDPERLLAFSKEIQLIKLLQTVPKPAGIFCSGDYLGHLVCSVAEYGGIRVPEDLAIMGGGGEIIGELSHPPLTSVIKPMREIGRTAVKVMADWLRTGTPAQSPIVVRGADLLERESTVGKSGRTHLAAVRRYIEENAGQGISMKDLTAHSQMSSKTLNQQYREAFGITPLEEAHQIRLRGAQQLLAGNQLSIGEIARRCGFPSLAAFSNYYERHTGETPRNQKRSRNP